jgi:hypothetical protein
MMMGAWQYAHRPMTTSLNACLRYPGRLLSVAVFRFAEFDELLLEHRIVFA